MIRQNFLLNSQFFTDNLGNSYFLEKEDKRGSMTKKKWKKDLAQKRGLTLFFRDVLVTLAIRQKISCD
jgi:hypothetical protein